MRPIEEELRRRIRDKGPITFAEFAELALYWSNGGYYRSVPWPVGSTGDFYTSPASHPAFGACLAFLLQQMWSAMGRPHPFSVVEPGAGDGLLCRDILTYLDRVESDLLGSLQYVILDRSTGLGLEQELPPALLQRVHRLRAAGMPLATFTGCVLTNELLDAFPVHRVTVKGGKLSEVYVGLDSDDRFVEVMCSPSTPDLEERFDGLGIRLPEGYRTEVNLGLRTWITEVAQALEHGFVLVVDYGHSADVLYDHRRGLGTLNCYHRHTVNTDPYQLVGRQDISVHVDITTLEREANRVGLYTLGLTTQRQFLMNLGLDAFLWALVGQSFPLGEVLTNEVGLRQLVREEGLGLFRVLALGKGVDSPRLHGFHDDNPIRRRMEGDPSAVVVPVATRDHMPLGRAPETLEKLPSWEELFA